MKKIGLLAVVFSLMVGCAKKEGCIDNTATNYDAEAEEDDGSCKYETAVVVTDTVTAIKEAGLEAFIGTWIGVLDYGKLYISELGDTTETVTDTETIILKEQGKGLLLLHKQQRKKLPSKH